MKTSLTNRRRLRFPSLELSSNDHFTADDEDTLSISSLTSELNSGLHYLTSNLGAYFNSRSSSTKRSIDPVYIPQESTENGIIINGSLFDEHLIHRTRSSYILDYSNTSEDLHRLLEGHRLSSSMSCHLDAHMYKLAFIMTLSGWCVDKEVLLEYCPSDKEILKDISHYKRFCFPELNPALKNGGQFLHDYSTYVFTRTLSDGQVEYGYCRRIGKHYNQITGFPIVICIVSSYSYFKLYDAILNELTNLYISNDLQCNSQMQAFYSKPLPLPTLPSPAISAVLKNRRLFFYVCPRDTRLNHDYFSTLLSCLSPSLIIHIFESMLRSKRLLLFSTHPSKLTKCCLALSHLIYPFIWPYSFVSLMPGSWLHDLLDSPCPFIYGCLSDTMQHISFNFDNETIGIDLDSNVMKGHCESTPFLPMNLRQTLESSLEYLKRFRITKLDSTLVNVAVSEAFLNVFIELFQYLPDFFKRHRLATPLSEHLSLCSDNSNRRDSGIDLQSVVSIDSQQALANHERKCEENPYDYEFRSGEFLKAQSSPSYVLFLKEFIRGMIFLKFLDDYQRDDDDDENHIEFFPLFAQRLNERRQRLSKDSTIPPFHRFRRTIDLLENQMKQTSKQGNSSFSKFLKNIFE